MDEFPSSEDHGVRYQDLRLPGTMKTVEIRHERRTDHGEVPPSTVNSLLLTRSGSAEVVIDGDTVSLGRNDFLYVEKGVGYRWTARSDAWSIVVFYPSQADASP
jgi:hypothetical protein